MTDTAIPDGFEPLSRKSPLTEPWEPIYAKKAERAVMIGLRLARPHTNGRGLIHGGLIAALADNAMGYSCAQTTNWTTSFVTVSLSIDFVGSAAIGQWCSIESDVIKTGKTICFAQSLIKADGVVIARASGTFRVVPKPTQTPTPSSPPRDR
ncbi:PaaI family thioesterase [Bradyrhizobium sp. RDM12]